MSDKHVRIEYRIRDDVDLGAVTAAIAGYVDGIRAHDAGHRYVSYRAADDARAFVHIGAIDVDRLADLQAQPFFGAFSAYLRERCAVGPHVTFLAPVAST